MLSLSRLVLHRCTIRACPAFLKTPSCNYSLKIGDPNVTAVNISDSWNPRWKKHWFLAMQRKAEIEGQAPPTPRSAREDWSYPAELAAFKLRLQIDVTDEDMQKALTEPVEEVTNGNDYSELLENGIAFSKAFMYHYIRIAYPKLPVEGQRAVFEFLLSEEHLEHLAKHLGYVDLLQTAEFPPNATVVSNAFLASIEAINRGSGGAVAAGKYILDFIVPQLLGRDILHDIWKPRDPMKLLVHELQKKGRSAPEARLVRRSGIDTVTPTFFVALFVDKEMLCESAGESIVLAETDAAKLALKRMYKIDMCDNIFQFGNSVDKDFLHKLFEPLISRQQVDTA